MNRIRITAALVLLLAIISLPAYGRNMPLAMAKNMDNVAEEKLSDIFVWVSYWGLGDAAVKINNMKDGILGISCFAAYFDQNSNLFIPDNLPVFMEQLKTEHADTRWEYYLTFVNDQQLVYGSSLKDVSLLKKVFENNLAMRRHIDQIIDLTIKNGFDGIEIDYEAIRKDDELWEKFIVFCQELYQRTTSVGLKLRIVLEPNAPLEELKFPNGPEYVMMCYNLYGFDENAGPKANDAFLTDLLRKMSYLPGKKTFALASGGFDWETGSKGKEITEAEATALIDTKKATVYRSANSGALTFQYRDENQKEHTVWFADTKTLKRWQNIISGSGDYNIMLWRIE